MPSAKVVASSLLLLLYSCIGTTAQTTLNVRVNSQGYQNYFLRQDNISTVTLTAATPGVTQRLLVASPAGNSGAVAYFNSSSNSAGFSIALLNGSLHSVRQGSNSGVAGTLTFNQNATLTRAIVGSVRAMRDYVEGGGLIHDIFNHATTKVGSSVLLSHRYINGSNSANLTFSPVNAQTTFTVLPDGNFTVNMAPGTAFGMVNFTWMSSEGQPEGYSPSEPAIWLILLKLSRYLLSVLTSC